MLVSGFFPCNKNFLLFKSLFSSLKRFPDERPILGLEIGWAIAVLLEVCSRGVPTPNGSAPVQWRKIAAGWARVLGPVSQLL